MKTKETVMLLSLNIAHICGIFDNFSNDPNKGFRANNFYQHFSCQSYRTLKILTAQSFLITIL